MRDFDLAEPALLQKRRLLKVTSSREIDASPQAVWAVISDHATWTQWHNDFNEHDVLGVDQRGLGTRLVTKDWLMRIESEVTRWESGRTIGLTLVRGEVWRWLIRSLYFELRIEPVVGNPDRCVVHYGSAFTGTILFWVLSAYSIGYALADQYWTARSSLKSLASEVAASAS